MPHLAYISRCRCTYPTWLVNIPMLCVSIPILFPLYLENVEWVIKKLPMFQPPLCWESTGQLTHPGNNERTRNHGGLSVGAPQHLQSSHLSSAEVPGSMRDGETSRAFERTWTKSLHNPGFEYARPILCNLTWDVVTNGHPRWMTGAKATTTLFALVENTRKPPSVLWHMHNLYALYYEKM